MIPDPCPLVTRRQFLSGLGASVTVAVTGGYAISVLGSQPALAAGAPRPSPAVSDRTLMVLEMGGGNDGLNTVVPHSSGTYHDLRGDVAVADAIDLDGTVGLHPSLGYIAARYRQGDVAIVEGVGYENPDLSHFASMSTWWSANSGTTGAAGWLGRYLDGTVGAEDPLAGIVIGPGPSPAMLGQQSFAVSIRDATGLAPNLPPWIDTRDELVGLWAGFADSGVDSPAVLGAVHAAIAATATASAAVGAVLDGATMDTSRASRRGSVGDSLDLAAQLVVAGLSPRVIYIHGFGDFDTHQGQQDRHAALLLEIDEGLRSFFTAIENANAADRVVVMTTSEFGRRAAGNGSGTDHGTAAAHLVLGERVTGGRFGSPPDLTRLDGRGNLGHTVDLRSYYATVLDGWLGADDASVLNGSFEKLPVFRPPRRHQPV